MFVLRQLVKNNINTFSIILYFILLTVFILLKPNFLYNNDGSLREFGLGSKFKTIIPFWLLSLLLAIISYFLILYYIVSPRLI
jgi:hypothetical protein